MRFSFLFLFGAAGLAWMTGCRAPGPQFNPHAHPGTNAAQLTVAATNRVSPEWLQPSTNAFTLGPGDRVEIEVIGEPATRTVTSVGPDGRLYFHLLPGTDVWGLTLPQAKDLLEGELRKFVRNDARIALSLRSVESQRVWLLGRLNKPGVFPLSGPMTLLEAVSLAGGPTVPAALAAAGGGVSVGPAVGTEEIADLRRAFVVREGRVMPVDVARLLNEGDLSQNIYLQGDDLLYLPSARAREVYVLGAVLQPTAAPYAERMTVIGAVAVAGGTIKDAYLSHVAIVRGSFAEPQVAIVNYKDIVRGRAPDVFIEPHDIVYVPFTPYRVLSRYADLVLNTFARTLGANMGARLVDPDADTVTPDVSITPAGR